MRRTITFLILIQTGLLAVEWFSAYDTVPRRLALMLTNIAATWLIILAIRAADRRHQSIATIAIILGLLAIWADAVGNFTHQYGNNWWYDHLTHAFGVTGATAMAIEWYRLLVKANTIRLSPGQVAWIGFAIGQALGAIYEVSEYLGDQVFATHRVGEGFDTSRDLVYNLLGGLLAVIVYWPVLKALVRRPQSVV